MREVIFSKLNSYFNELKELEVIDTLLKQYLESSRQIISLVDTIGEVAEETENCSLYFSTTITLHYGIKLRDELLHVRELLQERRKFLQEKISKFIEVIETSRKIKNKKK